MTTYLMTAGWASVAQSAIEHDLPEPIVVRIDSDGVDVILGTIADLAQWAGWADATIAEGEPKPYGKRGEWIVHHEAVGTIHDLPVRLASVEFGRMAEPDHFECGKCGAAFGVSGGFVPDGTPADDHFEVEVARHQSGECARTVVAL